MDHVTDVAAAVSRHPDWMVLLGARPTEPFVFVAKVSTLVDAGRQFLPDLHELLAWIAPLRRHRRRGLGDRASLRPGAARQFLPVDPRILPLLALRLPPAGDLTWCDWGTPERVLRGLRKAGIEPSWMGAEEGWIPHWGST